MSVALRMLMGRTIAAKTGGSCLGSMSARSMAVMKPMTPEEHTISKTEFWAKNKNLGRPISPHLTIYKFQLTSVLSITHRGTGLFQSALLSGAAVGVMLMPGTFPALLDTVQTMHFGAPLIFLAKFGLSWPVTYHLFNGCRHLAWDMGHGFKLPELYKTGWAVVALSVVTALAMAAM